MSLICWAMGHRLGTVIRVRDCNGDVTRYICGRCEQDMEPRYRYIWPDQTSTGGAKPWPSQGSV